LAILFPVGAVVLHFGALNSLTLITGVYVESWFFPKALLTNKWHIRGVICSTLGVLIVIGSAAVGLIEYGIFLGGALMAADPVFSYLAIRNYRRSKRRT
jgi:uncharacterized membrane protein (UPF0136 family)